MSTPLPVTQYAKDDPIAESLIKSVSWLMFGVVFFLAFILAAQMYFHAQHTPDAALTGMLGLLVGAITAAYGAVFAYKFGSTQQSKAKDETIQRQAESLAKGTGNGNGGGGGGSVSLHVEARDNPPLPGSS